MGLNFMEHILILTHDPDGTRDWWVKNLGFRSGDHPEFGFPVHWLYIGDQDVVHIGKANFSEHQNEYLRPGDDSAAAEAECAQRPRRAPGGVHHHGSAVYIVL